MRKLLRSRAEGQSLIVAALAMVVLVALSGLAVDGSRAFEERRRAATAADAAALSATSALAQARKSGGSGSAIRGAVQSSLADHGLSGAPALQWEAYYTSASGASLGVVGSGSVPAAPRGVRVELSYQFNTFLMPVLGRDTLPAAGAATAVYGPIAGPPFGGDLIPLTLQLPYALQMRDSPGRTFVFSDDARTDFPAGNFGAVDLVPNPSGNGNNATGNNQDCFDGPVTPPAPMPSGQSYQWCNGTVHDISVGDEIAGNPGMVANSLRDEVRHRRETRPAGLIPIYDVRSAGNGANARFRVVGFLAVELLAEDFTGGDKYIEARFVDFYVTAGAINPNPNALDTGVYAINLID